MRIDGMREEQNKLFNKALGNSFAAAW